MHTLAKATVLGLGLLAGAAASAEAQYYYGAPNTYTYGAPNTYTYGVPNTYSWSPYNYPGYQTSYSGTPYYYSYPGYGYTGNYPSYNYYLGTPYPAPRAFWDPYAGWRPYSDNAGPKASGHGSP
jgi:hypothetical protein